MPCTRRLTPSSATRAPKCRRMSRIASPGCNVTRPIRHRDRATGDRCRREKRCRVGQVRLDRHVTRLDGAGSDDPPVRHGVVDDDSSFPQHGHGHLDVGPGGDFRPDMADVDAVRVPGADEQQAAEELAGRGGIEGTAPSLRIAGEAERK